MISPVGYINAAAASISFKFPSILIKKNLPLKNEHFRLSSVSDDGDTYCQFPKLLWFPNKCPMPTACNISPCRIGQRSYVEGSPAENNFRFAPTEAAALSICSAFDFSHVFHCFSHVHFGPHSMAAKTSVGVKTWTKLSDPTAGAAFWFLSREGEGPGRRERVPTLGHTMPIDSPEPSSNKLWWISARWIPIRRLRTDQPLRVK
jgi:hypothetical protein